MIYSNGKKSYRRSVSEVIATLILLSITVVGAAMISVLMQTSGFSEVGAGFSSKAIESQQPPEIKITGYDTRDGSNLFGINGLNNNESTPRRLCTTSCNGAQADLLPSAGGTEFIVLRIKNEGNNAYTVNNILINDVDHLASPITGSIPAQFPLSGQFSIISSPTDTTIKSNVLQSGDEVLIIIKLNKSLFIVGGSGNNIDLNFPLTVEFTGSLNAPSFIVLSGDIM